MISTNVRMLRGFIDVCKSIDAIVEESVNPPIEISMSAKILMPSILFSFNVIRLSNLGGRSQCQRRVSLRYECIDRVYYKCYIFTAVGL